MMILHLSTKAPIDRRRSDTRGAEICIACHQGKEPMHASREQKSKALWQQFAYALNYEAPLWTKVKSKHKCM